jgi:hypothetical protein
MRVSAEGRAGFPQIFIMDPDRNVVELNAGHLLTGEEREQIDLELDRLKQSKTR